MHFSNILYFVRKRIFSKDAPLLLLNIAVAVFAFFILTCAVVLIIAFSNGRRTITKSLADDINQYGVVHFGESLYFSNERDQIIEEIIQSEEVKAIGSWFCGGLFELNSCNSTEDYYQKMLEIQNNHTKPFFTENDQESKLLQIVSFSRHSVGLFDFDFDDKIDTYETDDSAMLLILGAYYKEIPCGVVLEGEQNTRYIVAGHLKKGGYMFDGSCVLDNGEGLLFSTGFSTDNLVIVVSKTSVYSVANIFEAESGYSMQDADSKIDEILRKYGSYATADSLDNRISTVLSYADWLIEKIDNYAIVLIIASVLMLLTAQMILIWKRNDEFGVWISCGYNKKMISLVLLCENALKMTFAGALSYALYHFVMKKTLKQFGYLNEYESLKFIFRYSPILFIFIAALVVVILSTIIPVMTIKRKSVVQLVKNEWE